MRFSFSTSVFMVCTLLASMNASATTYYVRMSGADSNNGHAPTQAFATIKKAAEVVVSGDTVYVGAGTYTDAITLDGVQQSTSLTRFIADTLGTQTGDAGNVVISDTLGVLNSNYVEFHAFQFQGAASWFVVWKGSYEGLMKDCVFTAGNEPLLVKDGEVILENCQLTNFVKDGVYVDGEAFVMLLNTTISGGQEEGIEVSKMARVVLDGATIENNQGDGIKVEYTSTTIDDGITGSSGSSAGPRLVAGKYRIMASGGMFDGYDSDAGDYATTNGPFAALYSNTSVSISSTVPVNGDVYYGPSGSATAPNCTGSITQMSDTISMDPVDVGDAATNNNNGSIPPSDNGTVVFNGSAFSISGANGISLPPGTYYFSNFYVMSGAQVRLTGPTTIYCTGDVLLNGGSVLNPTQKPADFKLSVMGTAVTFAGIAPIYAAIYAPNARISKSGSINIYGMAVANEIVMSGSGGFHLDIALANYAAAVQGISSGASSPAPPAGWATIASGDLDISSSSVSNNRRGIHMETGQVLATRDSQYSDNAEWGLYLNGMFKLDHCTVSRNGIGGMWVNGVSDGEFAFLGLTMVDNASHAIYLQSCDITFDGTWLDPSLISGSDHVLATSGGKLTIDGLTISGGAVAGVLATGGELMVTNATFTGNGYGVAADGTTAFAMDNSTVTNNSVGLYLHENFAVKIVNTEIDNNATWGATVYASPTAGANVAFATCDIHDNTNGVAVMNASVGDVSLYDLDIRNNSQKGLHFEDCNLTLSDQTANDWRVSANQYNISSRRSTLTLSSVRVDNSTSYGLFCEDSDITLTGCTIQGRYGIYADAANNSLTVNATRLDAGTFSGWGVVRYGGDVTIKNSIFHNFWGGMYLSAPVGAVPAMVYNSTIGNAGAYGLYVAQGDATVRNTILTGDGNGYGLIEAGSSTLTHSHNLLDGFSTPFSGTSADATELLKSPRFVDAATGDYHLGVGSPAINAGFDLGSQVPADMDGNARPSFNAYEIGAYEYVDANGSFRVLDWKETR